MMSRATSALFVIPPVAGEFVRRGTRERSVLPLLDGRKTLPLEENRSEGRRCGRDENDLLVAEIINWVSYPVSLVLELSWLE
jgi:hypothetical protein